MREKGKEFSSDFPEKDGTRAKTPEVISLLRNGTQIDVEPASFLSFPAFEKHVAVAFSLGSEADFVIIDVDRDTVIDAEVHASMRSGEFWKLNPHANRLFMVLDDISASFDRDVELEISYQPHFNTITKTGEANFSKIPYAVAELVDNSIQATCANVGPRKVDIEVELGGGKGSSFLIVKDNGRGMNAKGLKDFATYFLTQKDRGVLGPQASPPSGAGAGADGVGGNVVAAGADAHEVRRGGEAASPVSNNCKGRSSSKRGSFLQGVGLGKHKGRICSGFISKFGVGALQAGFYIGSRLTVVTKPVNQPQVYEFVMDEAEYERRAETNSTMFRDKIKLRKAKQKREESNAERASPLSDLLERLRAEEEGGRSHFTYVVLTLRDHHVEWFLNHERGSLKQDLASIYHYYLHPSHCPDGIRRVDASGEGGGSQAGEESEEDEAGASERTLDVTYTLRNRNGQVAEQIRLANVEDDLGSRLNQACKDSFRFQMEILDPNRSPKQEAKRLPVTGVIHYYPYDGDKETRPQVRFGEEDDDSTTIQAFWEGRLVPESHAASLSFFPLQKLKKKDREAVGSKWKRRIKGMLFFDWHFPISNNKLKLLFTEGDLHSALNASNVPPKHPAVIYPGRRAIDKEFKDWLIKCHETLDREYRFDDRMSSPPNSRHDRWRKMTFGKGEAVFVSDARVRLPFLKPIVYGVINFFMTEVVEDEDDEGRGQALFSLQRWPEDVFGVNDADAKLYPVTELDPYKSTMSAVEWDKAMQAFRKQLPVCTTIIMKTTTKPLPKRLTLRTGKHELTKVSVQILDGFKKPIVGIPQGKPLRVHSLLDRPDADGMLQRVLTVTAKPFTDKRFTNTYFFDSMSIKEPGEYTWTVAVATEGVKPENTNEFLLKAECVITVLPGNPVKLLLEGDDWEAPISLSKACWLPSLAVKLRDVSKCTCPMRAYKSVTIKCSEEDAFDVVHAKSASSTHHVGRIMSEAPGPLEYDEHSWKLVPKKTGILSATSYVSRTVAFAVSVVAHVQPDRPTDPDEKELTTEFEIIFQPGAPVDLVRVTPYLGEVDQISTEAGARMPSFALAAMDDAGNRTAPSQNETWLVRLGITSALESGGEGDPEDDGPDLVETVESVVAAGVATFHPGPVLKWEKTLKQEGETAIVDATLVVGTRGKEVASTSFPVLVKPSKKPTKVVVCIDGRPWPAEAVASAGAGGGRAGGGGGGGGGASPYALSSRAEAERDKRSRRRSFEAGSVIPGLQLRLLDQGGNEVVVGKETFESNKEAVTCTWDAGWRWSAKGAAKAGGLDRLPDLKVPTLLSQLSDGGVCHAKVTVCPKVDGEGAGSKSGATTTLSATFSFSVLPGPVNHWMAVRADTGKPTENVGALVVTAGINDPRACQSSFAKVIKGFLPVDRYGNRVRDVAHPPEIRIEGMPDTKLLPEQNRQLAKPSHPDGLFTLPRTLNLIGPPCEGGHVVISPRAYACEDTAGGGAAAAPGGTGGTGAGGPEEEGGRQLRLAVSLRAGPPVRVLIRSPKMNASQFSNEIRATLVAGFEVSDLEVCLVDEAGNPCTLEKPVKVLVVPVSPSAVSSPAAAAAGVASPRAARRPDSVSKLSTTEPVAVLPQFELQVRATGAATRGGGRRASATGAAADTSSKKGMTLSVRVEGAAGLDKVEEAFIHWTRRRTSAVTAVHLAAVSPPLPVTTRSGTKRPLSAMSGMEVVEEPEVLSVGMGQRGRRSGIQRAVDGPLPSLLVWLETDNGTPLTPAADSIALDVTTPGSDGSRPLTNSYNPPESAPESVGRPHALVFRPRSQDAMEYNVGDHIITCSYVERRSTASSQGSQREAEERAVEMSLRVLPGAPRKLVPLSEDEHLFKSLSASNQAPAASGGEEEERNARAARRLVEQTFRFTASDSKGNLAGQIKGPVRMRIRNLEGVSVPQQEMPRLENSDGRGYVYADPTATGVFLFEENWLQPGVGIREGDYMLVVDSEGEPELEAWSTRFRFDTDQKRLEYIREVKRQLRPLQEKMDQYNAALHATEEKEDHMRREVEKLIDDLPERLPGMIAADCPEESLRRAKELAANFMREQLDREQDRARPVLFEEGRLDAEDETRINPIGYIVELGYVEDERIARLLSMKAGSKMRSLYVSTEAQMAETVAVFKIQNRTRNEKEMEERRLPLRPLKEKGFIDYLVNMIQLPEDSEGFRDTIFYAIYGSMVMFDTNANAFNYQKACKNKGQLSLPILVKEDGTVLERTGFMSPNRGPGMLDQLKQVFGAMPANLTPEFARADRYIKHLQYLIPAAEDLVRASQEADRVRGEEGIEVWRAEIDRLTKKLEHLGTGRRVPSSLTYSPPRPPSATGGNSRRSSTGGKGKAKKRQSGGGGAQGGGSSAKKSRR